MTIPAPAGTVHVVVPDAIDDPLRPSGGNRYDRRICCGLAAAGWRVHEHPIPDAWPALGRAGERAAGRVVAALPDGAVMLVDGLIACAAPQVFVTAAIRLHVIPLVHMPLGADAATRAAEAEVLTAARAVIATSQWTRNRLLSEYRLAADRVYVAEPGVDPATPATGSVGGRQLLCVGPLTPHKGQDVLIVALAAVGDHAWRCTCVGTLDRDPAFSARLRAAIDRAGLCDRLRLCGPLTGPALDDLYRSADLLVHPARAETYGMVVTEALARGVPVIATAAGGLPGAIGYAPDGARPGILVPPGDAGALATALRNWLTGDALRRRLRSAALARSHTLPTWSATAEQVARVFRTAAA